jgi:hypothetical protein
MFPEQARSFTGVPISDLNFVEIGFRNSAQGIDLGGMLFVPEGDGPFPGPGHAVEEPMKLGSRIIRLAASQAVANFILQ